jgi:hypothetical protein
MDGGSPFPLSHGFLTVGVTLLALVEADGKVQISASGGDDKPVVEKFHSWFRSTASLSDKAMALVHAAVRLGRYDATKFGVTAPNLFEVVVLQLPCGWREMEMAGWPMSLG